MNVCVCVCVDKGNVEPDIMELVQKAAFHSDITSFYYFGTDTLF